MSKKRTPKLTVTIAGRIRYIEVASREAVALQDFLRLQGLQVSPPGPCSDGVDTIQLNEGVDTEVIQKMLDRWPGKS